MPHPPSRWLPLATLLCSTFLLRVNAFYLPGAAPHDYHAGEEVNLFVNALTPMLPGTDHAKLVRTILPTSLLQSLLTCSLSLLQKSLINCTFRYQTFLVSPFSHTNLNR